MSENGEELTFGDGEVDTAQDFVCTGDIAVLIEGLIFKFEVFNFNNVFHAEFCSYPFCCFPRRTRGEHFSLSVL